MFSVIEQRRNFIQCYFRIEEAQTGTTKCAWCEEKIKKGSLRLRFTPPKYLEGLRILLEHGEKGHNGREEVEKVLKK